MDNLTKEARRRVMQSIKSKGTSPEVRIENGFKARGWFFEKHAKSLPGRPDFVFQSARVAVFVDGDFWHGWRFSTWQARLSPFWLAKIQANRTRDVRNFGKLRRAGWRVIRIWEHQVNTDIERAVERVAVALEAGDAVYKTQLGRFGG